MDKAALLLQISVRKLRLVCKENGILRWPFKHSIKKNPELQFQYNFNINGCTNKKKQKLQNFSHVVVVAAPPVQSPQNDTSQQQQHMAPEQRSFTFVDFQQACYCKTPVRKETIVLPSFKSLVQSLERDSFSNM